MIMQRIYINKIQSGENSELVHPKTLIKETWVCFLILRTALKANFSV